MLVEALCRVCVCVCVRAGGGVTGENPLGVEASETPPDTAVRGRKKEEIPLHL